MTRYLVLAWNGHAWCVDNSDHAVVRAGPHDTESLAQFEIDRAYADEAQPVMTESAEEAAAYADRIIRQRTRILAVAGWPTDPPVITEA